MSHRRPWLDGPPRRARKRPAHRLDLRISLAILAGVALFVGLQDSGLSAAAHCERAVFAHACYDGDTCTAFLGGRREDVRLVGFDTPELNPNARCRREHELGLQARDRLRAMIGAAREREFCHGRPDDYERDHYGRVLAVLRLDGSDVADAMLDGGYAEPFPLGYKPDWCR